MSAPTPAGRAPTLVIVDASPSPSGDAPVAASGVDGGARSLGALIGRERAEVERRVGPPEGTSRIWVLYAADLSVGYNRGVAVRVKTRVADVDSCTEAANQLGFDRAEPSRPGQGGVSHCVLERPTDGGYRGSIVGRLHEGVFIARPVARSRCGNELLR